MKEKDLSIIIVSYNTADLLVKCIESILVTVKKISYEIIVVDNASTDDTIKKVKNEKFKIKNGDEKLRIIQNKQNFGFSKANNIGIRESEGRYILFLNPDTVIYEQTLDSMVEFMDSHKEAGAATCFVKLPNGQLDDAAHRGFPTPWRAFCHFTYLSKIFPPNKFLSGYNLLYYDMNKTHEVDACAGAFMLVRRESGNNVGWWDEDYFWYGEDLDLCFRLKMKGWKIYFVPDYKILHYKGVSGGIKNISKNITTANAQIKQRATTERFKAMQIFYNKHYKQKYPFLISMIVLLGIRGRLYFSRVANRL